MTEGVCCDGADYDNVYQSAARTWSIQVGERLDAEVGIVGFTSQGLWHAWAGPQPSSRIPHTHLSRPGSSSIVGSQERNYTGIDAILVSHGTNDEAFPMPIWKATCRAFCAIFGTPTPAQPFI
jgi:hypothetical protein